MGLFSSGKKVDEKEFTWKSNFQKNKWPIFLETGGLIGTIRVPIHAIETVVIETLEPFESLNIIKAAKEAITPRVILIGKGTKLAYLKVGIDIANEIQDWLLEKVSS